MRPLKNESIQFLSQARTIPYEKVNNQDTEFVQDLIQVKKFYFPSEA